MITLDRVTKRYPAAGRLRRIIDDASAKLPGDRNIALLGRNGAGKSTLMRLIAGTVEPDEGQVHRRGTVSWPLGHKGGLHGALTGAQNIRFVARIYGRDTRDLMTFVAEFSELDTYLDVPVAHYSTGMRGRLAFGLSMGVHFDTYLVDEVIGAGDQSFRVKCRDYLNARLRRSNLIMVSHNMNMIRDFCDCALVVEGGRLSFFGDLERGITAHMDNLDIPADARGSNLRQGAA
ncbi:MAG: ABC transporter ATP-binding protein [Pseudomonadota bacterium]